mmetsp:Transcript_10554/g.38813  ORF Transcript_10554/g.38813 Transcript_10554/m.38813 type:complete len:168 (+) Transcript_10554:211-714(+)
MAQLLAAEVGANSGKATRAIVGPSAEPVPGPFELLGRILSGGSNKDALPEVVSADTSKEPVNFGPLGVLALLFSPLFLVQAFILPNAVKSVKKLGSVGAPSGTQVLKKRGFTKVVAPRKTGTVLSKRRGTIGVRVERTRKIRGTTLAKRPPSPPKKIGVKKPKRGLF